MEKQVLIHVKGIQTTDQQDEEAPIEIVVPGEYYYRNGSHYLRYEEIIEEYQKPTVNFVKISNKGVEVRKKGLVEVQMVFEPGKRNVTFYSTPYGRLQMGISTTKVDVEQGEKQLKVHVEYALDMNDEPVADCFLTICADESSSEGFHL